MNKNLVKLFFRKIKNIKLDKEKKNSIRDAVLLFVKENPQKAEAKRGFLNKIFSAFGNIIVAPRAKFVGVIATSFAIILLTGSLATKAESALPGDILYPVKTGINEKVMLVLSFSNESKTNLNVKLTERRLQEIEQLIVKKKTNKDSQTQINNNFNNQVEKAVESIDNLNKEKMYKNAASAASDLESSLSVHKQVLEELKKSQPKNGLEGLISKIEEAATKASNSGESSVQGVLEKSDTESSEFKKDFDNKLKKAKKLIAEAKKIAEEKKDKLNEAFSQQIKNNLSLAEQKIIESENKVSLETKDYNGALLLLQDAIVAAKESKNLIDIKEKLGDINITANDGESNSENINNKEEKKKEENEEERQREENK